jgi:flagellar biogenesis protein FliO
VQNKLFLGFLLSLSWLVGQERALDYDPSKLSVTYSAMYTYVFKLLLIFGVIIGFLYIWRKFFFNTAGFQSNQNLKIIEKLQLDLKSAVYLIELNGKYFLISSGDKPMSLIDSFGKKDPEVKYLERKSFEDVLKNMKKGKKR